MSPISPETPIVRFLQKLMWSNCPRFHSTPID